MDLQRREPAQQALRPGTAHGKGTALAQVNHWQIKQHWQRYIICAGISLVKKQYWKSAALAKEQHRQYVQMNDGYVWHPK